MIHLSGLPIAEKFHMRAKKSYFVIIDAFQYLICIVARRSWPSCFFGNPVFWTAGEVAVDTGSNHPGRRFALIRVTVAEAGSAAPWVVS